MKIFQKICLCLLCLMFTACDASLETNMSSNMLEFQFTTEEGLTLSSEDLKGEWWIANLVYTNCRTICPRTTANMVYVQRTLHEEGIRPSIVSFTVDPENDSPEVLKRYAETYGVDSDTWSFLTGYDFETIQEISETSFVSVLREGAEGQRSHGYGFYLINPNGEIVKKYDGMSEKELEELMEDIKNVF